MSKVSKQIPNLFKDKKGEVVLAQWPNVPLVVWFVGLAISKATTGNVQDFASLVSLAALVVWAGMEIYSGVNYFRRSLGVVVLIFTLYSRFLG